MSTTGASPEFESKLQEIGAKSAHMVIPRSEIHTPLSEVRYPAWTDEPESPSPAIPAEAIEAVAHRLYPGWESSPADWQDYFRRKATEALEAAAPHMLIHVHHHDIEKHAESFNEGYETCMAQELADDPTTAQDWLDEKLRAAKAEAWEEGYTLGYADCANKQESNRPNPHKEEA